MKKTTNLNGSKKFLFYLSYGQLNLKSLKHKSIGFNKEKQKFILVFSSERNLNNMVAFTKLCTF